jgi:hypothetical protein
MRTQTKPALAGGAQPLSAEDREIAESLDLLEALELLEAWDSDQELPISELEEADAP